MLRALASSVSATPPPTRATCARPFRLRHVPLYCVHGRLWDRCCGTLCPLQTPVLSTVCQGLRVRESGGETIADSMSYVHDGGRPAGKENWRCALTDLGLCLQPLTPVTAFDDWLLSRLQITEDEKGALSELKLSEFSILVECPRYVQRFFFARGCN